MRLSRNGTDGRKTHRPGKSCHHLIRVLETGGETAAAAIMTELNGGDATNPRTLLPTLQFCASVTSGRRTPYGTTRWSRAGPRLPD